MVRLLTEWRIEMASSETAKASHETDAAADARVSKARAKTVKSKKGREPIGSGTAPTGDAAGEKPKSKVRTAKTASSAEPSAIANLVADDVAAAPRWLKSKE